jgi:hypothetical protein
MNSKDYRNIREAYLQVYAPQELTEEQVWEGVENWVNSLLEEGYDLSDYTWEEMYEEYLNEAPTPTNNAPLKVFRDLFNNDDKDGKNPTKGRYRTAGPNISAERPQSRFARPMNAGTPKTYSAGIDGTYTVRPKIGSLPPSARKVTQYPQGVSTGVGGGNAGASIQAPTARPGTAPAPGTRPGAPAPPTRPAAASPAASRPTATSSGPKTTPTAPVKPAMGTTAGGTKFERRTPTSAELGAAQASRSAGGSEEDAIKAGVGASKPAPTPAASPSSSSGSSSPSGETDRLKKALDIKKSDVTSSFDMFDVVKGYLIGEGYADTEEAALAIMANMSEDWKYSIMETRMDPRGRPASGPMNVYANSKRKPDQEHLDAVKSYDEKQKKKTPEQRKKELDDYMERQMNNK